MREQRRFGERTVALVSDEPRRKYYLVYEGVKTEAIYFNALIQKRGDVGINDIIDLVPIVRSYSEMGESNPKKIVENIMATMNESREGTITYRTLLDWIMDGIEEFGNSQLNDNKRQYIWRMLERICNEELKVTLESTLNKDEIRQRGADIVDYLLKKFNWPELVRHVEEIITKEKCFIYDPEIDKICLIIDRDRQSFKIKQYDYVLQQCREQGFGFYLSNPCFEFWLLLHYSEVLNLTDEEKEQLRLNKKWDGEKRTPKRTYAENLLRRHLQNYQKNHYDAIGLVDKMAIAMKNAKCYCEDEELLKNHIGSRIGILLAELSNEITVVPSTV